MVESDVSKTDYFIEETNKRLEKIDAKLDMLINFRLILMGSAATLSIIFSVLTTLVMIFLDARGGS